MLRPMKLIDIADHRERNPNAGEAFALQLHLRPLALAIITLGRSGGGGLIIDDYSPAMVRVQSGNVTLSRASRSRALVAFCNTQIKRPPTHIVRLSIIIFNSLPTNE